MTKHPEPVLQAAAPWERPEVGGLWGPVHAHFDPIEQVYKLWYSSMGAYPADPPRKDPTYRCLATSPDGLNWERPNLGLFEYAGSTRNNIFTDHPDVGHGMLDCPEMAATEPAERRYKAAGWGGFDDNRIAQLDVYFSPDGLRWQPYAGNPVLRGRLLDDTNSAAKLRESPTHEGPPGSPTAKYALLTRIMVELGGWRRRCVGITTSEDDEGGDPFTHWNDPLLALAPDQLDDDMSEERLAAAKPLLLHDHPDDHHCEFYGMLLYPTSDLYLGFAWTYDVAFNLTRLGRGNEYAIVDVQLLASRDLVHWQRHRPAPAGHRPGRSRQLRQPHDLLPLAAPDRRRRVVGLLHGLQRGPRRQEAATTTPCAASTARMCVRDAATSRLWAWPRCAATASSPATPARTAAPSPPGRSDRAAPASK